jgi:hypothetical protein
MSGMTLAAPCDPMPIGRMCQCQLPNGSYVLAFSGYNDGNPVQATVVVGSSSSTTPIASVTGTTDSSGSCNAYGELSGVVGTLVVTLKVGGPQPGGCGPHTMADDNTAVANLDECPWC